MPQRPLRLNLSNYYYTTTWFGGQQNISVFFRNALNIFQAWKAPLPNLCVIAHFIGRGACVYCRLLSVLLMQIIKFGGKLVVNPRCSSIEHHDFKRSKANFYVLLLNRLHRGDRSRKAHKWLYFPLQAYPCGFLFPAPVRHPTQLSTTYRQFGVKVV